MKIENVKLLVFSLLATLVVYELLTPIVFAAVLAYLVYPLFNMLNKLVRNRFVSAITMTGVVLFLIMYPATMSVKSIITNAGNIAEFISGVGVKLSMVAGGAGQSIGGTASTLVAEKLVASLTLFAVHTPTLIIDLFILLALVFFFLRDGPDMRKYLISLAKTKKQTRLLGEVEDLLHGIILGNFASAIIIGLLGWVGFYILGFPYAGVLGVIVGVSALLPVVGSWMVYGVLASYEAVLGDYMLGGIFLLIAVVMALLEAYLGPRISSFKTRVHPGIMLVGFVGGPIVFGLKGIIIGPIILGTLKVILDNVKK